MEEKGVHEVVRRSEGEQKRVKLPTVLLCDSAGLLCVCGGRMRNERERKRKRCCDGGMDK